MEQDSLVVILSTLVSGGGIGVFLNWLLSHRKLSAEARSMAVADDIRVAEMMTGYSERLTRRIEALEKENEKLQTELRNFSVMNTQLQIEVATLKRAIEVAG
jgi:hypothetical protein